MDHPSFFQHVRAPPLCVLDRLDDAHQRDIVAHGRAGMERSFDKQQNKKKPNNSFRLYLLGRILIVTSSGMQSSVCQMQKSDLEHEYKTKTGLPLYHVATVRERDVVIAVLVGYVSAGGMIIRALDRVWISERVGNQMSAAAIMNSVTRRTRLAAGLLGGLARAMVRDVIFALAVDVEATVAALKPLLEQPFEELATVVADGGLRVRVDDKRVGDLDPARHLLFDPVGPAAADGWPPVLLMDARARAPAGRAVGNALSTTSSSKRTINQSFSSVGP